MNIVWNFFFMKTPMGLLTRSVMDTCTYSTESIAKLRITTYAQLQQTKIPKLCNIRHKCMLLHQNK